jgi:hypothetical protein
MVLRNNNSSALRTLTAIVVTIVSLATAALVWAEPPGLLPAKSAGLNR